MGHWSEDLVEQAATRIGGDPDRSALREVTRAAAEQIELYAGRAFGQSEQKTMSFWTAGAPFVEVDDLQVSADRTANAPVWPVPDPVHPEVSSVLQVQVPAELAPTAVPIGEALRLAGEFAAIVAREQRLTRDYLLRQLFPVLRSEQREAFLRWIAEPTNRFQQPVATSAQGGWWMQITRRVILVTPRTRDEQRLVEPVLDPMLPLVATEPFLVVARLTAHPTDYAFAARIWTRPTRAGDARPWRYVARAIHGYGVPVLTVDAASTPEEGPASYCFSRSGMATWVATNLA